MTSSDHLQTKASKKHSSEWLQRGEMFPLMFYIKYEIPLLHFCSISFYFDNQDLEIFREEGGHIPWTRLLWSSQTETSPGVPLGKPPWGSSGQRKQVDSLAASTCITSADRRGSPVYIPWLSMIINSFVFIQTCNPHLYYVLLCSDCFPRLYFTNLLTSLFNGMVNLFVSSLSELISENISVDLHTSNTVTAIRIVG